jgi:lipid-binding SYLF domain-containing protein
MKKTVCAVLMLMLIAAPALANPDEKRTKIDETAAEALETLFSKSEKAESLFAQSYGYAVFDNVKVAVGITGSGGKGVAVIRESDDRTYMNMGSGGVGLGLGGQAYQVVFLFQDKTTFRKFVDSGWQAETSATASAANKGVNAASTFVNGLAVYQLTEAGLMAAADITGTKYWKADKLNE